MTPVIITTIIASATLILAIFGASWLNQQAMNKRLDDLKSYFDARFDSIEKRFSAEIQSVRAETHSEIQSVRVEVSHLNQRMERIERQLDAILKPVLPKM
jgi:hypothetical protein